MIRRFIAFYKPYRLMFFGDMLCVFLVGLADLFYPTIVKNMINDYVPNGKMQLFMTWTGALLLIYLCKAAMSYYIEYYGHVVGIRMQAEMRNQLFRHLQRLPFSYFDEHKAGDLMSRLVNDLLELAELAHHGPENVLMGVVMLVGSFTILSQISLPLTCIVFATVPLVIIFALAMQKKMDEVSTRTREELSEVNSALENSLSGIRVTRAYTNSAYENRKFAGQIQQFVKASAQRYKVMSQLSVGVTLFTDLLYFIVMSVGGLFFFRGEINVGEFTMFLLYINTFLTPIRQFWSFFERLQSGMTGFRRVLQIIDEEPEAEKPGARAIGHLEGVIDFEDVSFSYIDKVTSDDRDEDGEMNDSAVIVRKTEVISHLNLHIAKGSTVALVGPSGGGKTTLCHLIPRFYDLSGGRICIDGQDISDFNRESLRRHIGIVAQDVFLFTGSIRENIAYGNLEANEEEIITAAQKAKIHDFISGLPDGYDTYIGERGAKLSGGQKQRISIARVFLKNPSILILDEATSALDNATETLIQSALEDLAIGRTTIIVAHRLSTIKNADEIIVLTPDGILERGSHEQLLAREGLYADLYNHQFKEPAAGG